MIAISEGVDYIRETDDDNSPYESFYEEVPDFLDFRIAESQNRWINIYSAFTERHIWPRGFPLNQVNNPDSINFDLRHETVRVPTANLIQQSLADADPYVDAVYRMTAPDRTEVVFRREVPVKLPHSACSPFNSQATTWPKRLFPLMYLPATCSLRMTDIWRSFVVKRALREVDSHLVFMSANAYQDRNLHNLMGDFKDEIEGYLGYDLLIDLLESLILEQGEDEVADNLRRIYEAMARSGFVSNSERDLLDAWLSDLRGLGFAA